MVEMLPQVGLHFDRSGRIQMLAWHNSAALKAEVSARMLQHRIEDSIIQGTYQEIAPKLASKYRGCLIGCTLPLMKDPDAYYNWHGRVTKEYGIPKELAHAFDTIFEGLPRSRAAWFAVATIEAIPVGADLSGVADLLGDDIEAEAKRGRKNRDFPPRGWDQWVSSYVGHLTYQYSDPNEKKKFVWIAERLLKHLSEAPVPGAPMNAPESTPEPIIPASHEVVTYEEATRVHEPA